MHSVRLPLLVVAIVLCASPSLATTTTGWTEYAANPVYSPTGDRAYYPTVVLEGGTYRMWSDGSSSVNLATSSDGINWATVSAVTGLTNPRHTLVENIGETYRIWYWNSGSLYSIKDIRTATSTDGVAWTADQVITQVGATVINNASSSNWNRGSYGPADILYNPSGSATLVEPIDEASVWANRYVMYYDGTTGGDESLGLAVSNDGINWQGYNGGVAPVLAGTGVSGDWDADYVSRATVIKEHDDAYHMWYSGGLGSMDDGLGYAFSMDGIAWTRAGDPIFCVSDAIAWRDVRTYTPMVIGDEMWFTGRSSAGVYAVGYATGGASPVPEPLSLLFFGTGLACVAGFMARKRKRIQQKSPPIEA